MPPQEENQVEEKFKDVHVSHFPDNGGMLMGSDRCRYHIITKGNNVISINIQQEEADEPSGLTAGGTVMMPMSQTFWVITSECAKTNWGQLMISFNEKQIKVENLSILQFCNHFSSEFSHRQTAFSF
jgi:uncharacterized glyoxalase superfamily protein PhnB